MPGLTRDVRWPDARTAKGLGQVRGHLKGVAPFVLQQPLLNWQGEGSWSSSVRALKHVRTWRCLTTVTPLPEQCVQEPGIGYEQQTRAQRRARCSGTTDREGSIGSHPTVIPSAVTPPVSFGGRDRNRQFTGPEEDIPLVSGYPPPTPPFPFPCAPSARGILAAHSL